MSRLATWAATNGDQPAGFQGSQAMTDIAFIASQVLYQFQMTSANTALSALILRPHPAEDLAMQFREASCRHEDSLYQDTTGSCG
jgi:hypothetical protein